MPGTLERLEISLFVFWVSRFSVTPEYYVTIFEYLNVVHYVLWVSLSTERYLR